VSRLEDKLNEAQGLRRFDPRLSFQPSSNKVLPLIIILQMKKKPLIPMTSVTIREVYPGSRFFSHPGSRIQQQKRVGGKKILLPFLLN
jgi:hypothetical protein